MEIIFLSPARDELTEAIAYYNGQSEGLGYEFAAEVKKTLERIVKYPNAWFKLSKFEHIVAEPIDFLMESFIRLEKKPCLFWQ